ncbi:aldehyde dehydrogenase family protein [Yoonia sp. R2331]|uniref:aldehyde dehydrogenase family protein n=1 Tax=Yoonia sp. R2331 TaxID=3237238 RepID=UPI0034E5480C
MLDLNEIKILRSVEVSDQSNLIDGRHQTTDDRITVTSPIDGAPITTIPATQVRDVDAAVIAARAAYADGRWRKMPLAQRKAVLLRWADLIDAEALPLAVLGVRDNGTELAMALKAEPASCAQTIRYYAEAIDKVGGEIAPSADDRLGLIHRQPIGVIGVLTPWNFPLMIGAWKIGPALAMGNSVVLKPSESASLSLLRIATLALEAGLPSGVFNVVTGHGHEAGAALAGHDDVDALLFTGSGGTGRQLLMASAQSNLKPVYLELGGKSPNVIFDDTSDIEATCKAAIGAIFRNSGQTCVAGSRLLVQSGIKTEVLDRLVAMAESLRIGDPLDPANDIGAVHSHDQLKRNLDHVAAAQAAGVRLVTGGHSLHDAGSYMAPTIFDDVRPSDAIFRDEVFGPVLTVTTFDTEAEAIALANDSDLGLAAGVWTSNFDRANRMVRDLQAGVVHVNTYGGTDVTVPMGGVKQSGYGYDRSLRALDQVSHMKTAWMAVAPR